MLPVALCSCTPDTTYFNLAIAPILRNMPQQKLRVLAELQVRAHGTTGGTHGNVGIREIGTAAGSTGSGAGQNVASAFAPLLNDSQIGPMLLRGSCLPVKAAR